MNRCNSPKNFLSAPGFACETVAKESKNMTTGFAFCYVACRLRRAWSTAVGDKYCCEHILQLLQAGDS